MTPQEFLDQPISVVAPTGYPACLDCGDYFHHKIIWCPKCGKKIVAWTDISIADFIRKTSTCGYGSLNTLLWYLYQMQGTHWFELTPENRAIYDYAEKISEQARKEKEE